MYLIGKYYIRTITNLWYMYCWCNTTASILQSASNSYKPHNNIYKHLKVKGNCFYIANWSEMPLEKVTYCSSSEKAHNNIWWLNMKNSTDVIQFINDCRLMYIYSNVSRWHWYITRIDGRLLFDSFCLSLWTSSTFHSTLKQNVTYLNIDLLDLDQFE